MSFWRVLSAVAVDSCSLGMFLSIFRFVGLKGNKPRAKDLSSRVAQFVYESKISLAIVFIAIT
jgi:anti-anti-sigma regulatory factor